MVRAEVGRVSEAERKELHTFLAITSIIVLAIRQCAV